MKNLIIIGARGWGREVYGFFKDVKEYQGETLSIKGFLDDKSDAMDGLIGGGDFPPILSSVEEYDVQSDDFFICALGNPVYRKKYAEMISAKGGKFITYISPTATIGVNTQIGEGCVIASYTIVSDNVIVGDHCMIHPFCVLGHDTKLSANVSVEACCFFGGYSEVGELSTIHVRSTILAHRKIGREASVGAGSVVIRDVQNFEHVFGNPARRIGWSGIEKTE